MIKLISFKRRFDNQNCASNWVWFIAQKEQFRVYWIKKKLCPILIYVHFKIAWMYKHELVLSEISSYHVNFLKITCRLILYMLNILCQHHYFFLLAQKQTCFNYVSYFIHFSHVFAKNKKNYSNTFGYMYKFCILYSIRYLIDR